MALSAADQLTRKNNKTNDRYSLDARAQKVVTTPLARYQVQDSGFLYVAEAEPGTALTDTNWRVWRQTNTATTNRIEWAGGTGDFIHAANDMPSLSYS